MLTGKYLNKYYVKYFWFYFVGVIGLVAVDYLQLYVPDFLGRIVKMFNSQGQVDMARLSNIILALIGVALACSLVECYGVLPFLMHLKELRLL